MLVLSRKKQETIHIGDDIEVVVLEVGRNRVRLGFRCPPHISITRSELRQAAEAIAANSEAGSPEVELVCV